MSDTLWDSLLRLLSVSCESRSVGKFFYFFHISWNKEGKCRSLSNFTLDRDVSMMRLNNVLSNRQSEPCSRTSLLFLPYLPYKSARIQRVNLPLEYLSHYPSRQYEIPRSSLRSIIVTDPPSGV